MKGSASHLLEFLDGSRKRFIIPVYQCNYDWKQEIGKCRKMFILKNLFKVYQIDEDELAFGLAPIKEENNEE